MNRKEEYLALLQALEHTPAELEYTVTRAEQKLKANWRRCLFKGFVGSLVSLGLFFAILVNSSLSFAYACGRIPLLKELARLVAFSPSLSAAVENQYVQPIELEQRESQITARVEYVIVDQKRLEIFYSLASEVYSALEVTPEIRAADGSVLEGYSISSGSFHTSNEKLRRLTVDFVEKDVPATLQLILNVYDHKDREEGEAVSVQDALTGKAIHVEPDYITGFTFLLEFDPYYTEQGETVVLNQTFELDGQTLTATTVEIYPTHIRLNLEDHQDNSAWLKALSFYLEDEKGNRYEAIANGITATGSVDSPMMESHRLESSFFSDSKSLTLYITGVTWLDKEMEKVLLDLRHLTAEALPQGVIWEEAEQQNGSWLLTFSARGDKENAFHQIWDWDYYDPEGKKYHLNGVSSTTGVSYERETGKPVENPDRFTVMLALEDYPFDRVYLCPAYSRVVTLSRPVEIKVK